MNKDILKKIIFLIILTILVILLSIVLSKGFNETIENLFTLITNKGDSTRKYILREIRIPRVLLSFLVGGMLSVSGVVIQSILCNPLASSYTMGVSSGASLGIGLFLMFNIISPNLSFLYPLIGFIFSILTTVFVIVLCKKMDCFMRNSSLILIGMVVSLFLNSLLSLLTITKKEGLSSVLIWQMGSFSSRGLEYIISVFPFFLISFVIVMMKSKEMDLLTFGDQFSSAVGINPLKEKVILLMCSCILTGASISTSGVIGFVDLITPHICRKIFSCKHSILTPMSFVLGGVFMVLFDTISRTFLYPSEIPISIINSLIGTPIFCYIFFKSKRSEYTY